MVDKMETVDVPPNQTVYVRNLNEKVKKDDLRRSLYHVFSAHGNILEIHVSKRIATRGQAWIVFDSLAAATKAVREMKDFIFYGKPMVVNYAKDKSDVIAKLDGTFQPRTKRKAEDDEELEGTKQLKRTAAKKRRQAGLLPSSSPESADGKMVDDDETAETEDGKKKKSGDTKMEAEETGDDAGPAAAAVPEEPEIPNRILFISNLPAECNELMLTVLFRSYEGFERAQLVAAKPGVAFVMYKDELGATQAKEALNNFEISDGHHMKVSFAKQ